MIRPATEQDIDACFDLARQMYGEFLTLHGIEIIDTDLMQTVKYFINSKQVLVIDRDGVCGMCAWILTTHPANSQCKIFQEVLWTCNSKCGSDALAILRAMDKKSKVLGANITVFANLSLPNEEKLKRIYGRLGFVFMESHFARSN
jgi:hypothetical protein